MKALVEIDDEILLTKALCKLTKGRGQPVFAACVDSNDPPALLGLTAGSGRQILSDRKS